ncbi:hypothetical protein DL95DRAFT_523253 [Leptodontidium sp. 2 PMI_412]|nr:hypothetical protein DL95DRAFT_523253 [Leptodontidium sp. 2 PMI_412]
MKQHPKCIRYHTVRVDASRKEIDPGDIASAKSFKFVRKQDELGVDTDDTWGYFIITGNLTEKEKEVAHQRILNTPVSSSLDPVQVTPASARFLTQTTVVGCLSRDHLHSGLIRRCLLVNIWYIEIEVTAHPYGFSEGWRAAIGGFRAGVIAMLEAEPGVEKQFRDAEIRSESDQEAGGAGEVDF